MTRGRWPVVTLAVHAAVLTAVTAYLALALQTATVADANIGAGMALLGLAGLGLPWSLLVLLGVVDVQRQSSETAFLITFALSNVVLHAILALFLTRPGR